MKYHFSLLLLSALLTASASVKGVPGSSGSSACESTDRPSGSTAINAIDNPSGSAALQAGQNASGSTGAPGIPWERPEVDPPSGLTGAAGNDAVFLDWNPNLEENIMGYRVFRREKGQNDFREVRNKLFRHASCKLEDQDNGESYEYAVKAVLANGAVSDFSNKVMVTPEKTKSPSIEEGAQQLEVPGYDAMTVSDGLKITFENGHQIVFDKSLVRVRDWQTDDGKHLLVPRSYGNPVDITRMNSMGFSEPNPATSSSPALPPRINLDYANPDRERKLGPRYVGYKTDDNRVTIHYQIPLSGPGIPLGSNWDLWVWANVWETWYPAGKELGGISYQGLSRKIELEIPSYYDEGYSVCLNDGFGLNGSCEGATTIELSWHDPHLREISWSNDEDMTGLARTIRESRKFHPDGYAMQTLPFIFANYPAGTMLIAPQHYYYAQTYAMSNYVGQGQDGIWPNLKIDVATAGERFTVESYEYLWSSDQSIEYPQKYMDASFHYRDKLASLYQVNPHISSMAHAWDYWGPDINEVEGKSQEEANEILREWAEDIADQAEDLEMDMLGGAHRLWTSGPEATPDDIRLNTYHPINQAIKDAVAILQDHGIGFSYWVRPEFTRSAIPNVLSERFIAEIGQYAGSYYPHLKSILETEGIPLVRDNKDWIRTGMNGEYPLVTSYNWVPMSLTHEGWYDEVVYKLLVMMKKLGYADVFQDGLFGCMAGIDYTGGKARPVQPYYWRYFSDIYRLGMTVNGECLIGWGNNTVGQVQKEDMNHLWAYTHGIHRGNRAGDRLEWFTPEMLHQTYQLYMGTYLHLDSDKKIGAVAGYVKDFIKKNGHPDRVFLEGMRWSAQQDKWVWDTVWWEYKDGRRVRYPNYDEVF